MRRVFGLGETLLDIIFKENTPISAKAGGSVLNALVSLSRMGFNCSLISEIGDDKVGKIIKDFLIENNVSTQFIHQYNDVASTLALAFLDSKNDATYQFYKSSPAKRFATELPTFSNNDILLFGSSLAINSEVRDKISTIADVASKAKAIIIYDPNCRKNHTNDAEIQKAIEANFAKATIVRCSDEDLQNIYGKIPINEAVARIKPLCKNIVVTQNSKNVIAYFESITKKYAVKPIVPISTIGAGDNFNAGIISSLVLENITNENISQLTSVQLDTIINTGINFSTQVCMLLDNYLPIKQN